MAGISLIFGLLAAVICLQATDADFYTKEYRKLGVAKDIGISAEDLEETTRVLMDYTTGEREDMVVEADFGGERKEFFNDKEKSHMIDVRKLYLGAERLAYIALIGGAVILAALMIFSRQRSAVLQGYRMGNYIFLAVFALIALYAAMDFSAFWTSFHHVFFTNDLWLLDPDTDNMILMFPERFFFDLVFRIVAWFAGIGAVLYAASWLGSKKIGKKGGKAHVS